MKFQENLYLVNGSEVDTLSLEGGSTWIFAQNSLAAIHYDLTGKSYFEVGPKHGLHTMLIDLYEPGSITCVEAPNKFRSQQHYARENGSWVSRIRTENFDFHYQDFGKFTSIKKYDLLFYSGIIYHNVDQMGQLRKLHEISNDDAFMVFESSTTRNESLIDLNVVEVHHPPYSSLYRNIETCSFHPSKKACKSMLEMSGWEIIDDSDNYKNLSNRERIIILCKRSTPKRNRHLIEK